MKWQKTTLRKGTKTPKICRDMYITVKDMAFMLITVKNGRMHDRVALHRREAEDLIGRNSLVITESKTFSGSATYRDPESTRLVSKIHY